MSCKWDNGDPENILKLGYNEFFNGGWRKIRGTWFPWISSEYQNDADKGKDVLLGHCRESQANLVFMFMVAVVCVTTALMLFLKKRKGY